MKAFALPAAAVAALLVGACSGDRSAESESGVAEAEVETTLPEEVISDQELQAAADQAAAAAGSATVPADAAAGAGPMDQGGQTTGQAGQTTGETGQTTQY